MKKKKTSRSLFIKTTPRQRERAVCCFLSFRKQRKKGRREKKKRCLFFVFFLARELLLFSFSIKESEKTKTTTVKEKKKKKKASFRQKKKKKKRNTDSISSLFLSFLSSFAKRALCFSTRRRLCAHDVSLALSRLRHNVLRTSERVRERKRKTGSNGSATTAADAINGTASYLRCCPFCCSSAAAAAAPGHGPRPCHGPPHDRHDPGGEERGRDWFFFVS